MTNSNFENMYITGSETKNVIQASNNRSRYYAELAEKYKDEAKGFRDDAQYYAEQNADVSKAYVDEIDITLRNLIATKQNAGNYALSSEIPAKLSDLTNDTSFVNSTELSSAISAQALLTTAEIGGRISVKANKDCDNLSAAGKDKVVALAHELDWSNAIAVSTTSSTSTQTYTATADGMFFVVSYMEGGSSAKTSSAYIIKNEVLSSNHMYGNTMNGTGAVYLVSTDCYIKSGEQINYYMYTGGTATYKECQATFVPFKKS